MGAFKDITGMRFERLTAVSFTHVTLANGRNMPAWLCRCDCGREKVIQGHHLRGGKSGSCGCSYSDPKPGGSRKDWPGYGVWWQMIQRCENSNVASFAFYGARGITVCERWRRGDGEKSGFECFFDDMGPPNGLTIDRIDPDGNYELANCRWATDAQQRVNTRRSIHAVIGGVKVPLIKYSARTGIPYEGLRVRVRRDGMSVCDAARVFINWLADNPGRIRDEYPRLR